MNLICEHCRKPFEAKRKRRFCDRRCAATISAAVRGTPVWSTAEQDYLAIIAGTLPLCDLIKRFKMRAKSQGWPQRTDTAIAIKLKRMGESRKCTLDNFTIWELARALDVPFDRVELWTERGLKYRKVSRNQGAIALKDFIQFCKDQPQRIAGIDPQLLEWITGDAELAQAIAQLPAPRIGYALAVQRLDTGEVFPSIRSAAKASYVSKGCISDAIARGGTSAGARWRYVKSV